MRRFFARQVGRGIKRSGARGRRRSHPARVILSRMPEAQLSFPCHPEPKAKDLGGWALLRIERDATPDRHDRSRTSISSARPAFSARNLLSGWKKATAAARCYSTLSPSREDPSGEPNRGDRGSAEGRGGQRHKEVETVCLVVRAAPRGVKVAISPAFWGKTCNFGHFLGASPSCRIRISRSSLACAAAQRPLLAVRCVSIGTEVAFCGTIRRSAAADREV